MMFALASLSTINAQEKKSLIGDYLSISGWMNIQYDYESQLQNDGVTLDQINTFNVRRARLDFKGNLCENVEFRVQGDLAGTPKLVDGFVKVKLQKYFNIQVGQFKIPFTFENPQSPLTLEGIEYAQVISKLSGYSDMSGVKTYSGGRDVGVMIYGNFFSFEHNGKEIPILTYKLAVFNGNGMNNKDANLAKDIAGSIEVCPVVKGLMLAASYYDGNYKLDNTFKINDSTEVNFYENNAIRDRFTVGGKYENGRLTVRSEYITGKTDMANKDEELLNVGDAISDIDSLIEDEKVTEVEETIIESNDEASTEETEVVEDSAEAEETKSIEDELEEAKGKISDLENQVNALTEEKKTLSDELEEKKSELERLNDSLNSVNEEITSVKDQAKRLAVFNKKLLADNLKALDNKITDEELEGKTAKEITDMIEVAKNTVRELAPTLQNPGALMSDSNTIVEDEKETTVEENFKTMKDLEEVIKNFFN